MKLRAAFVATAAIVFTAQGASAALTSSEKAQVRDFIAGGRLENAQRVRSLVARTDLTAEESVSAMTESLSPLAFDESRAAFVREVLFGGASSASRSLLAQAVVRGLLARADALYTKHASGLEREPRATSELVAIYGFIDGAIANAGKPTAIAHDATAGISSSSYEDSSKALRDHVDRNARWLKGDGAIAEAMARVRAQAQIALLDMLPDGLTRRVDAADRIGLKGARRQMLTEWGVLLVDAGKIDETKAEQVRQLLLGKLAGAREGAPVLYSGEDRGPLRARGPVFFVGGEGSYPFGEEVSRGAYDPALGGIALDLSTVLAKRALDGHSDLRASSEHDAATTNGEQSRLLGKPRAPSVDHAVGAGIHLLLTDAPRAVDLAFARLLAGKPESAGLLTDALGALVATSSAKELTLGKGSSSVTMSKIRLAPNGSVTGFSLEGHDWTIDRGPPVLAVTSVRRDGQPLRAAHLATAKASAGSSWTEAGYTFSKLHGAPRVALAPGAAKTTVNVKIDATGDSGYDGIATSAPGNDVVIEGELAVRGGPGGIAFRAAPTPSAFRGAMLVVHPKGRTVLATSDEATPEALLQPALESSPPMPTRFKIVVSGGNVEATIGANVLKGTLPKTMTSGDIAVIGQRGATIEVKNLVIKRK